MNSSRRHLLAWSCGAVTALLGGVRPAGAWAPFAPRESAAALRSFLTVRSVPTLVPKLVEAMLAFYRGERATGLASGPSADMLLFQWGVHDWGRGERFEVDITRQFIAAQGQGDDAISQLNCTAFFVATPELRATGHGNLWCHGLAEVDAFAELIRANAAYRAVQRRLSDEVRIAWGSV